MSQNIEIRQGGNKDSLWTYTISYCGLNKEKEEKCNFYHINIEKMLENYFFISRDGLDELSSTDNFFKANKKAYKIAKNIAKIFYRDLVPEDLKNKVKIIDKTNYSKPSN